MDPLEMAREARSIPLESSKKGSNPPPFPQNQKKTKTNENKRQHFPLTPPPPPPEKLYRSHCGNHLSWGNLNYISKQLESIQIYIILWTGSEIWTQSQHVEWWFFKNRKLNIGKYNVCPFTFDMICNVIVFWNCKFLHCHVSPLDQWLIKWVD